MMTSDRHTEVNTFSVISDSTQHVLLTFPPLIYTLLQISNELFKKTKQIKQIKPCRICCAFCPLLSMYVGGKAGTAPSLIRHITKAPTKAPMQPRGIVLPRMTRAHKTISIIPPHNTFSRHLLKVPHHHRYAGARLPVCILSLSVIP